MKFTLLIDDLPHANEHEHRFGIKVHYGNENDLLVRYSDVKEWAEKYFDVDNIGRYFWFKTEEERNIFIMRWA